jgi:hypothetical protein
MPDCRSDLLHLGARSLRRHPALRAADENLADNIAASASSLQK